MKAAIELTPALTKVNAAAWAMNAKMHLLTDLTTRPLLATEKINRQPCKALLNRYQLQEKCNAFVLTLYYYWCIMKA